MANHAAAPEPKRMEVLQHIRTLLNQRLRSEIEGLAGPKPSSHHTDIVMNAQGHEYIAPTVCYGMGGTRNFKNAGRWYIVCTRADHLKKGLSCQYPQFLSERPSSIAMEKLQKFFLLYCMTGTKWGTTPYPELEVFTKFLARVSSIPTENDIATTQQPTPPSTFVSYKSNGKKRARSLTPTVASKKTKYNYTMRRVEPSTASTPASGPSTARSTAGTITSIGQKQPKTIYDPEIIEISDSD